MSSAFQLISRLTLYPAYHPEHQNLCQAEEEIAEHLNSSAARTQDFVHDFVNLSEMPTVEPLQEAHHPLVIDPENMAEFQFVKEHNGFPHKARVNEELERVFCWHR